MSQEITTMRQPLSMSALGAVSVQAAPAPIPAAGQLWVAQRELNSQRLNDDVVKYVVTGQIR